MGDVYKEQIVKRKSGAKELFLKVLLVLAVIVITVLAFAFLGGFFAPLLLFGSGFGAFYLMSFLNLEYEYQLTNADLDIDCIYNRSRRKRIMTVKLKELDFMAHIDDKSKSNELNNVGAVKDFSSGTPGPDTYVFTVQEKGVKTKVIIEPNEKMLRAIAGVIPKRKLILRSGLIFIGE